MPGHVKATSPRFHGLPITIGAGADDVRDEQGDGAISGHGADLRSVGSVLAKDTMGVSWREHVILRLIQSSETSSSCPRLATVLIGAGKGLTTTGIRSTTAAN